jgi:hypothetical protein
MKGTFYFVLALLCSMSISIAQNYTASKVDFSGVDEFWKLVDTMENNIEPSLEQWATLFRTRGYSYLVTVEHQGDTYKRLFPLMFMPSRKAELAKKSSSDNFDAKYFLPHYQNVKKRRDELLEFQRKLEKRDLFKESLGKTEQYLPNGVIERFPAPNVAFVISEPDAHADSSIIVFDLLFALSSERQLTGIIGHEAHHYYLGKIDNGKIPDRSSEDYYLVHAIHQLRLEGMGDLIDKLDILDEKSDMEYDTRRRQHREDYRRLYLHSPETFTRIDSLISAISDDTATMKENGKKVWDLLPYGAHPSGYFMARAIVDNFGKDILIKEMLDPFAYVRLYNLAAQKASNTLSKENFVFSRKTMNFLSKLEKKYDY